MSNLLESIIRSQGGAIVQQIASQLGVNPQVAEQAVQRLMPALSRGIQNNTQQEGGLETLLGLIGGGNSTEYVDQPETLGSQASIDVGNNILGQIFGSKDVSRNVASHAAKETGLEAGLLKKMLPLLASVAIASMSKQNQSQQQAGSGFDLGAISSFLDADKDGSVMDDVLKLAQRFF